MTRPLLASALVYSAMTLLIGRAMLTRWSTAIFGDPVDPILNAGILAWNARNIPWTDAWFDFPAFYPAANALTFSEHLLGLGPVATPIYWLTGDAVMTYNVTFLATYVLCGLAMFALVWGLTGNAIASFLAGLAYAFAPYRASQTAHIQVLAAFWAPLALLGLHRFLQAGPPVPCDSARGALSEVERVAGPAVRDGGSPSAGSRGGASGSPRTRLHWLALFAVSWMMQAAANGYFLVFFSVLVGFWVLGFVLTQRRWRDAAMISAAAIVASLPLIPILLRFVEAHARNGLSRAPVEIVRGSADISSVLCAEPSLDVWGRLGAGVCGGERRLFPGLAIIALIAAAAWSARQPRQGRSRTHLFATAFSSALLALSALMIGAAVAVAVAGPWRWDLGPLHLSASSVIKPFSRGMFVLLLAAAVAPAVGAALRRASVPGLYLLLSAVMWALAWGPSPALYGKPALERGPYSLLMLLPGMDGLRVPARFWMMTVLCVCVAMGVLLAAALQRRKTRVARVIAAIGAGTIALDGWGALSAADLLPSAPRPDLLRGGIVLTLPIGGNLDYDAAAQLEAIDGGWRSVNGYSGYQPRHYQLLRDASEQLVVGSIVLSPFVARGDLNVVVHERSSRHVGFIERQPGVQAVAAANGLLQYRIPRQGTAPPSEPGGMRARVVSVSATCSHEQARLVLDDDSGTGWECGPQQPGQEITADLGAVTAVGQVVPALGTFVTYFPRQLLVETSPDGTTWTEAWDGGVLPETFEAVLRNPLAARVVLSFRPRPARYVRLRLESREEVTPWAVAELEIWSGRP